MATVCMLPSHTYYLFNLSNWFGDIRKVTVFENLSLHVSDGVIWAAHKPCRFCDLLKLCSIFFVLRSGLDHLLSPSPPSRFVVKCLNFCAAVCKCCFFSFYFCFPCDYFQRYFLVFCCFLVLLAQFIFSFISGDLHQRKQRHSAVQERKGKCGKTTLAWSNRVHKVKVS